MRPDIPTSGSSNGAALHAGFGLAFGLSICRITGLTGATLALAMLGLAARAGRAGLATEQALAISWVWSPYQGKLGPLPNIRDTPGSILRDAEPWWHDRLVQIHPSPALLETHWVPQSPSSEFVTVLAMGAPAPAALLLPSKLTKRSLVTLIARHFPRAVSLRDRSLL